MLIQDPTFVYDFPMVRNCLSCSINWKSIVNFCPQCGTDLHIQPENKGIASPINFNYEEQSSDVFKSPALWIFIGLLAFGAAFAVIKSSSGESAPSDSQSVQVDSQAPSFRPPESQVDANSNEPEIMQPNSEDQEGQVNPQVTNSEPTTLPKAFNEPKTKATLTLDAWLRKYSIDKALISIQKWSSTYRSINPTQIDEAQTELSDAVSALEDALRYLNSQGSSRISTYDQQQLAVEKEVQNYMDQAGPIWLRINNGDFGTRQEIVDFLADNIGLLGKVNSKVNSLLEWLNSNSSKYEVR